MPRKSMKKKTKSVNKQVTKAPLLRAIHPDDDVEGVLILKDHATGATEQIHAQQVTMIPAIAYSPFSHKATPMITLTLKEPEVMTKIQRTNWIGNK